jgi:hypothetical protein
VSGAWALLLSVGLAGADAANWFVVAAHPDDELVFINPDLQDALARGLGVTTVFLTAGDAGLEAAYWLRREAGMRAAYAAMAGVDDRWASDVWTVAGHGLSVSRLQGRAVALVFMRLPDGMPDGAGSSGAPGQSLARLWRGEIPLMMPRDGGAPLSRGDVVRVLAGLLDGLGGAGATLGTLSCAPHPREHGDHLATGMFAIAAAQASVPQAELRLYMGSAVLTQPTNLEGDALARKAEVFARYARYDTAICDGTRADCAERSIYGPMLRRHYVQVHVAGDVSLAVGSTFGCSLPQ